MISLFLKQKEKKLSKNKIKLKRSKICWDNVFNRFDKCYWREWKKIYLRKQHYYQQRKHKLNLIYIKRNPNYDKLTSFNKQIKLKFWLKSLFFSDKEKKQQNHQNKIKNQSNTVYAQFLYFWNCFFNYFFFSAQHHHFLD